MKSPAESADPSGKAEGTAPELSAAEAAVVQAELLARSITNAARFEAKRIVAAAMETGERHDGLVRHAEYLSDEATERLPPVADAAAARATEIRIAADERAAAILARAESEGDRIRAAGEQRTLELLRRAERRVARLERRRRRFRRQLRAPFMRRRAVAVAGLAAVTSLLAALVVIAPGLRHTDIKASPLPAAVAASETAAPGVCPIPSSFRRTFANAARSAGVPVGLLGAVAEAESRFNPAAKSGAGAQGMLQLMPATARMLAVNPLNTRQNIRGGARYLRYLRDQLGSYKAALAAYHAGPTAQTRLSYGPETRSYVDGILSRRASFDVCSG